MIIAEGKDNVLKIHNMGKKLPMEQKKPVAQKKNEHIKHRTHESDNWGGVVK